MKSHRAREYDAAKSAFLYSNSLGMSVRVTSHQEYEYLYSILDTIRIRFTFLLFIDHLPDGDELNYSITVRV